MVEFLTLDDVLESHREQILSYGGGDGIRDMGFLESAIAQPEASSGEGLLDADIFEVATA